MEPGRKMITNKICHDCCCFLSLSSESSVMLANDAKVPSFIHDGSGSFKILIKKTNKSASHQWSSCSESSKRGDCVDMKPFKQYTPRRSILSTPTIEHPRISKVHFSQIHGAGEGSEAQHLQGGAAQDV